MPLTMEHIKPKSLGGSDDLINLAAACYRCNECESPDSHLAVESGLPISTGTASDRTEILPG
jgi:5-methylcytosine-specific restriction endonuclease McrA